MRKSFRSSLIVALCFAQATLGTEPDRADCAGFRFDVSRELRLLNAQPQAIDAPFGGDGVTKIVEGRVYDVKLEPQSQARFVARSEKPTMDEGSFAGVVQLVPAQDGNLRVSLSEAAWIDVLAGGKPLISTSHSGSHDCKALRKAVQFNVKKSLPLVLQLSGSTMQTLKLLVTQ